MMVCAYKIDIGYLFIHIVDANLLKAVVIKDFKSSNIQDTNVCDLLHGWIAKGHVALINNDSERPLVDGASNARH